MLASMNRIDNIIYFIDEYLSCLDLDGSCLLFTVVHGVWLIQPIHSLSFTLFHVLSHFAFTVHSANRCPTCLLQFFACVVRRKCVRRVEPSDSDEMISVRCQNILIIVPNGGGVKREVSYFRSLVK